MCFLGKTLLAFALLHSVLQGQICQLLHVFLDFLLELMLVEFFFLQLILLEFFLLELTPPQKCLFYYSGLDVKVGSQEIPGATGKFGFGVQNEAG